MRRWDACIGTQGLGEGARAEARRAGGSARVFTSHRGNRERVTRPRRPRWGRYSGGDGRETRESAGRWAPRGSRRSPPRQSGILTKNHVETTKRRTGSRLGRGRFTTYLSGACTSAPHRSPHGRIARRAPTKTQPRRPARAPVPRPRRQLPARRAHGGSRRLRLVLTLKAPRAARRAARRYAYGRFVRPRDRHPHGWPLLRSREAPCSPARASRQLSEREHSPKVDARCT